MTKEYVRFDTVLRTGKDFDGSLEINDVDQRDGITYFCIGHRQFQTYGGRVYAEGDPMYDHPVTKFLAEKEGEPDEFDEVELIDEVNKFEDHKGELMERLMADALMAYSKGGREDMLKVFEDVVDICPGKGSKRMIEMIIDRKEGNNG